MKPLVCLLSFVAGLTVPLVPLVAQTANADLIPVAVLDLETSEPKLKERGLQIALLLSAHLSSLDGVVTVERQELAKLISEQELGASGMVDAGTAARIGHLTGARVLVTGRIFTVAGEMTAALKIMSTETGRVFGAMENFSADTPPAGPAGKLAAKVAEVLNSKKSDLLAQSVTSDDRITRLKKKLAGRTLPSVSISIPEQHIGPPVIDPAAETEIGLILGEAGFIVLTGDGAAKADFAINGEAFSEAGIRRGSLISCRARVEVKVVARDGAKVALMDRQVTVAVDTTEHIAAKTALQNAGAALAERIAATLMTK